jgi:8-oxo-dGTP pyrophosphatase MutT (NUDIX family)
MTPVTAQHSAGGVVVDDGRVLMIRTRTRRGRVVWTFPKGRVEIGESDPEAALREVCEETGYACRLVGPLMATSFWFWHGPVRIRKTVNWFLLTPTRVAGTPNPREVDEVRWISVEEAYTKLSYRSDRALLARVENQLAGH